MPARSLAIVGCGPWGVTAREGALKIREAARMLAEGFDTDRLLHGGAVPLDARRTGSWCWSQRRIPTGSPPRSAPPPRRNGCRWRCSRRPATATAWRPLLAQIPMTVRLQLLAEHFARLRRQDPDVAITGEWDAPALWQMGAPGAAP